jgi:periplasmic protein TonB
MSELEKKNKRIGLMVSLGLHVALLILFFFILAWRQPNPPHPEYGIEINFGLDQAGSGNVQPQNRPTPQVRPEPEQPTQTRPEPVQERVEPQPPVVTRNEVQKTTSVQPDPTPVTEKPTKVETPVEKPKEAPKPAPQPQPKEEVKQAPKQAASTSESTDSKPSSSPSHGDQPNKVGDQGKPEGTVDARALYGTPGGGDGASFDLAGWNWDYIPRPNESSSETGRIVFRIRVDDRGDVTEIVTVERTVSPAVERVYREAVQRVTFSRTASGPVPPQTTGTITFIIRAR